MRVIKQQKVEQPIAKFVNISEMTIEQLKHMIEYAKAIELERQRVKERLETRKKEDDLKRQRIIKAYLEPLIGHTSFMRDFMPDRILK
jgi:regulator of replication initiation timing